MFNTKFSTAAAKFIAAAFSTTLAVLVAIQPTIVGSVASARDMTNIV